MTENEETNKEAPTNKIILDKQKLAIIEVDNTTGIENKIYETDDLFQVLGKMTKIKFEKKDDFKLVKNMNNGIFTIESEKIVTYGAFFFIKFNKSKKAIEIIEEVKDRKIQFIAELPNGNFAYNCYIHRPVYTDDSIYIFDITKNKAHKIKSFGEYDELNLTNIACIPDGFVFANHFFFSKENQHYYIKVVKGFSIKMVDCDSFGEIQEI